MIDITDGMKWYHKLWFYPFLIIGMFVAPIVELFIWLFKKLIGK